MAYMCVHVLSKTKLYSHKLWIWKTSNPFEGLHYSSKLNQGSGKYKMVLKEAVNYN